MVSSGTRGTSSKAAENSYPQDPFSQAVAYSIDAMQRSLLFCDVMRQRTEQHETQSALEVPHVLDYECELVINGRDLERPVNYGLVRIRAPEGTEIDERKRPFVVIDPRAGHGPGIGDRHRVGDVVEDAADPSLGRFERRGLANVGHCTPLRPPTVWHSPSS